VHVDRWRLLERLVDLLPGDDWRVVLLTTGSESVEAAIKAARNYTGRHEVISFHGAFHGRTYGSMSAGSRGTKQGFGPLLTGFLQAPYAYCYRCVFEARYPQCDLLCVRYLDWLLSTQSSGDVSSVVMEPYLGGGGFVVPPPEFMSAVKGFCARHGILLIVDEVQSGFGRTGKHFAFEHSGVTPDIVCAAKGLSSGVPSSAMIGRRAIVEALEKESMSSSYGANPLSCATALATLEVIEHEGLCAKAADTGQYIMQALVDMAERHPLIGDVRGLGLAIGVELVRDRKTKEPADEEAREIVLGAFRKGLLMLPPKAIYNNVLRLNPPLTLSLELASKALAIIEEAITEVEQGRHQSES
jgi:4-aminobutyrate aminotransferase-like enzyme